MTKLKFVFLMDYPLKRLYINWCLIFDAKYYFSDNLKIPDS
jgi:hypothetical protein